MTTRIAYDLGSGGVIMSPITHKLSLYYRIILYNCHYLTVYLYARGDLGTPEVTIFFPNVVVLQCMCN